MNIDTLIQRWKLCDDYQVKSLVLRRDHQPRRFEAIYREIPPYVIVRLLPDSLVRLLLASDFKLWYKNEEAGNEYGAEQHVAFIKSTHDLLHEIGHGLWYDLISPQEEDQKQCVIHSVNKDNDNLNTFRSTLGSQFIPSLHTRYATLVGAYSGQFLVQHHPNERKNDLEELFARNFDFLMKGKPLTALPSSPACLDDFLDFYREHEVIDSRFEDFYALSIRTHYDRKGVEKIPLEAMRSDPIDTILLERINHVRAFVGLESIPVTE